MPSRLKELFKRFLNNDLSPEERKELMGMALESDLQDDLKQLIRDAWQQTGEDEDLSEGKADELMQRIFAKSEKSNVEVIPIGKRTGWRNIAAAAAIAIGIGAGVYYTVVHKSEERVEIVSIPETVEDVKSPQTNRATITMADGSTVYLDSAVNGMLAVQGNTRLIRLDDGRIAYRGSAEELIYNTLTNPRGSKVINMTLSDGSQVWLNAGSSITYPVAFIGNERDVSVTGEAYFEVAHDRAKPFIVSKGDLQVQVLGTRFNINAYDDEDDTRITLLKGSVKVKEGRKEGVLQPGQQAQVSSGIKIISNVNVEQVMAWKNGAFSFKNAGIYEVMRQVSRWYDLDIEYRGVAPTTGEGQRFSGDIGMDLNLSAILRVLEKSQVHFKLEGKKLIVIL